MKNNIDTRAQSRTFRPGGCRTLGQEDINTLHNASLEIMDRTGMRFFDEEALGLFRKAGCRISTAILCASPPIWWSGHNPQLLEI